MSDQGGYEASEVFKKLMDFVRSMPQADRPSLDFGFEPRTAVTDYGVGEYWVVSLSTSHTKIYDYGETIQQAAERLLDRLLYPEKYPQGDD